MSLWESGTELFKLYATLKLEDEDFTTSVNKAIEKASELNGALNDVKESATGVGTGSVADGVSERASAGLEQAVSTGTFFGNLKTKAFDVATELVKKAYDWVAEGIEMASSEQESTNVINKTFQEYAPDVFAAAESAKNYGLTDAQFLRYVSMLGGSMVNTGMGLWPSTSNSIALTQRIGDLASMYNFTFDEVFTKVRSGLAGETEGMRDLGIDMTIASLESYYNTDWEGLSYQEQTAKRAQYILEQSELAAGDFYATRTDFENARRLFETNTAQLQADMSRPAMGVYEWFYNTVNSLFEGDTSVETRVFNAEEALRTNITNARDEINTRNINLDILRGLEEGGITDEERGVYNNAVRTTLAGMYITPAELEQSGMSIYDYAGMYNQQVLQTAANSYASMLTPVYRDALQAADNTQYAAMVAQGEVDTAYGNYEASMRNAARVYGLSGWNNMPFQTLMDQYGDRIISTLIDTEGLTDGRDKSAYATRVLEDRRAYQDALEGLEYANKARDEALEALAEAQTAINNVDQVVANAIESGLANINVQATVIVNGKEIGNVVTSTVSRNIAQAVKRQQLSSGFSAIAMP